MRRLISALLLMTFSVACSAEPMSNGDLIQGQIAAAWRMACEAKKVDCTMIEEPITAFALFSVQTGGMYLGGQIVLINAEMQGKATSVPVLVHEMTHYLQAVEMSNLGVEMTRCERERESYTITREIAMKYKLDISAGYTAPWEVMFWIARCPA